MNYCRATVSDQSIPEMDVGLVARELLHGLYFAVLQRGSTVELLDYCISGLRDYWITASFTEVWYLERSAHVHKLRLR